jgi:hypothetical protein
VLNLIPTGSKTNQSINQLHVCTNACFNSCIAKPWKCPIHVRDSETNTSVLLSTYYKTAVKVCSTIPPASMSAVQACVLTDVHSVLVMWVKCFVHWVHDAQLPVGWDDVPQVLRECVGGLSGPPNRCSIHLYQNRCSSLSSIDFDYPAL